MKIKALSLWEPWATLMRTGAKTIETRSWPTSYRGPLLICAAKKYVTKAMFFHMPLEILAAIGAPTLPRLHRRLHYGQAVAVVRLVECLPTGSAGLRGWPWRDEEAFGDYSPGRWAWCSTNLRRIDPFPVRGSQGLFEVELPPGVSP